MRIWALKGRDGLFSSVLALTAHIAAYQQGELSSRLREYLEENLKFIAREMNSAFSDTQLDASRGDLSRRIDLRPLNIDDRALQKVLIEQQKVAIMPGYTYGNEGNGFIRLNAGCPHSKLEQRVQRLIAGINTLLRVCRQRNILAQIAFYLVLFFIMWHFNQKRVRS